MVEGAWNGEFNAASLNSATTICGTAATLENGNLKFFSSTDNLSPLFSIAEGDALFISNSPVFVLSTTGNEPDPVYPFYAYDLIRIFRAGLNCQAGNLPTASGNYLKVHFNSILTVDSSLQVSLSPHPLDVAPTDYQSYKTLLESNVKAVFDNAQSPARKFQYSSLALISRGYDSAATASLAAKMGCKHAATFTDSRRENPRQDSGKELAEILGMTCTEYDRWGYLDRSEPIDHEFAFSTISVNPAMSMIEESLPCKILISGGFGGTAWEYAHTIKADNLIRPEVSLITAFSQLEFRLNVGYQIFAPAMVGIRHNQNLAAISISEEMKPWSTGNKYDKPIPRRIVEESGIPRNAFGMKKMASGQAHFYKPSDISKNALKNYEHFLKVNHSMVPSYKITFMKLIVATEHFLHGIWFKKHQDMSCSTANAFRLTALDGTRHNVPWKFRFMFQWAFDSLKSRYRAPEQH